VKDWGLLASIPPPLLLRLAPGTQNPAPSATNFLFQTTKIAHFAKVPGISLDSTEA
jgi:hypothetical protein